VERRTIQIQEEAARVEEERVTAARAEIPAGAFEMSLYDAGIKEHILNILTEAEYDTVGNLMMALKIDPDKVLGLPGIGPKAMENIQESLEGLTFPEPELEPEAEVKTEIVAEEAPAAEQVIEAEEVVESPVGEEQAAVPAQDEAQPEAIAEGVAEAPAEEKAKEKKSKKKEEEALSEDADLVKDDVSLDELFALKEMFQTGPATEEEEESDDKKKKGKKKKKKHVEIEYDEELGEVVARKKHKRGEDGFEENW
jgi:N utilization substance protein A